MIARRIVHNTIVVLFAAAILRCAPAHAHAQDDRLLPGIAVHAFDHLGNIGDQAGTAAACGANIIYAGGFGSR